MNQPADIPSQFASERGRQDAVRPDMHTGVIPVAFNLSTLVPRSVASLYSHLVTRPTGQALRLGIESQIEELASFCVSILDFSQVVVLDYSCADEVIAKLLQRYQRADRTTDAYFLARGLADEHREPIQEVLVRHQLALVAEVEGAFTLLGHATEFECQAWSALQGMSSAEPHDLAASVSATAQQAAAALATLRERRTVLRPPSSRRFYSLTALLNL